MSSPFQSPALWKNKNFLLLWIGYFINLAGTNIYRIAILWWVLQKTGTALQMGTFMILSVIPTILLSPLAGVFVDRFNPKKIMAFAYWVDGLVVLILASLESTGALSLTLVYSSAVLLSTLAAFVTAANFSILPQIVPKHQLVQANALQEFSVHASAIVGASLGGMIIGTLGILWAFAINSISSLIFAFLIGWIHHITQPSLRTDGVGAQLKEGLYFLIKKERTLLGIMLVLGLVNFAAFPIFVLLPLFAQKVFHTGPEGLGWMEATTGIGAVVATLILLRFPQNKRRYLIFQGGLLMMGILFVLAGLTSHFLVFITLLGLMGFFLGLINIQMFSHFQIKVPETLMGRIMSLLNMLLLAFQPISYGLGGYLGDHWGAPNTLMLCGAGILIGATLFAWIPKIRYI